MRVVNVSSEKYEAMVHHVATLERAVDDLRSALMRTERNFISAVRMRPVRDMAENLAENKAALDSSNFTGETSE